MSCFSWNFVTFKWNNTYSVGSVLLINRVFPKFSGYDYPIDMQNVACPVKDPLLKQTKRYFISKAYLAITLRFKTLFKILETGHILAIFGLLQLQFMQALWVFFIFLLSIFHSFLQGQRHHEKNSLYLLTLFFGNLLGKCQFRHLKNKQKQP